MATFTTNAAYGAENTRKPRILSAKFGDGYEQRSADGINADLDSWRLSFPNVKSTDADTIEAFFVTAGGVTPFTWTPPRATTSSQFLCREWKRTIVANSLDSITATFEETADYST